MVAVNYRHVCQPRPQGILSSESPFSPAKYFIRRKVVTFLGLSASAASPGRRLELLLSSSSAHVLSGWVFSLTQSVEL
jgi:hypothetical protein